MATTQVTSNANPRTFAPALNHDNDYQQYAEERVEERKQEAARELADIVRHAQSQGDFLKGYLTKNPLAEDAGKFVEFIIRQLGPALDRPDLDQLRSLTDKVDLAIREAKLNQAFLDFQSAVKSPEALKPNEAPETMAITDKIAS